MYTLYCGDCLEKLKLIEDNSIDCIVTSPPYNKGGRSDDTKEYGETWVRKIYYDKYNDDLPEEDYVSWQIQVINECTRVLKPTGSLFYNHKIRRWDNKGHFPNWVFDTNANFYQMIVWDRGSACDVNPNYLYPSTELIFWLTKDKPNVYRKNCLMQNEIWKITPTNSKLHPATFPDSLVENCLKLTTERGDVVLDPFMGSGTTGIVSTKLQRDFIGIELSENYFEMSKSRIDKIANNYCVANELW